MDTTAIQRALVALGYDLGPYGPAKDGVDGQWGRASRIALAAFQYSHELASSGQPDPETIRALQAVIADRRPAPKIVVPADWMPAASLRRIIVHWTAGNHKASGLDRSHYHLLIEGDGTLVRGTPSIVLNDAGGAKKGYAAHTLNANTGSIGVSLCCMAGAVEIPFKAGASPMTKVQWEALPPVLAALCRRYGIPVTPKTVLSHAEVQANLGIAQRGKWDIARLAFDPAIVGAKTCGDLFRAATARLI